MVLDTAGSDVWTIGKLVSSVDPPAGSTLRVELPRFQRRLVWNSQQRLDLVESIYRGYPIGAVLLFKRGTSNHQESYQIVDGLQRTSTLLAYVEAPLELAPESVIPGSLVNSVAAATGAPDKEIRAEILTWMRVTKTPRLGSGFTPDRLARHLDDALGSSTHSSEAFLDHLAHGLDELHLATDISAVTLPIITYTGLEEELPEIFERINTQGTKLNKYEVFAATWINSETQINSEPVRVAINEKYSTLISKGFSIVGLEGDQAIQDFNLFEYLFGLGKVLVQQFPRLFSGSTDPAQAEPMAFSLATIARGRPLSDMKELPSAMPRTADGLIDPAQFEQAVIEAAAKVDEWLKPFIGLRLNSSGDSPLVAHGELQMVSIIARVMAARWETREALDERAGWQDEWDSLKTTIPQHYLLDIIRQTWRGPLYTILWERVWQTNDDGEVEGPSPYYLRQHDKASFDVTLDDWFNEQLAREQRSRPYVRNVERVFLKYVYTNLVLNIEEQRETFELEHLFPVSRLKSVISADEPGWPISCVANLALYEQGLNREKSAKTISEFLSGEVDPTVKAMINRLTIGDPQAVSMPQSGLSRETYLGYLGERWAEMKATLYQGLRVPDADEA